MTVYADVLLVINLFVNYALLLCARMILKSAASRPRMLLGAAVGSVYGLIIFLPEMPRGVELLLRLAAGVLIVLCSFGFNNLRRFLRCFFTFAAVNLAFGGIMLTLWVTVAPAGMIYRSGSVYFDIDLAVLAVSTAVCFGVVSLISHFASRRAPRASVYSVTVGLGEKTARGTALADTGNSLRDSFSGYPVIIGEEKSLENILPQSVRAYLSGNETDGLGLRLITHKTVSGTGIMPAFKPDFVKISSPGRQTVTDKVYIAVSENNIAHGEFDFILNPDVLDEEKNYAEYSGKN